MSQPEPPATDPSTAGSAASVTESRTSRWWLMHAAVVLAFLLFFVFVALLYWNWLRIQEPTASLRIAGGNPAYNNVIVHVEGRNLETPLQLKLGPDNRFGGRIYLRPGIYRVSLLLDERVLLEPSEVSIFEMRESTMTLPDPSYFGLPEPSTPQP